MYGYVVPKKDCLKMQDFVLYRSFYCGICKATGKLYGQFPRFTTNYDIVFLSVLMHDCLGQDVEFSTSGCVLNPIKKKATVLRNTLLDRLIATNIILSYFKVRDDIADGDGVAKKLVRKMLTKAYNRAAASEPKIDSIVKTRFSELASLEQARETSLDKVSHCFSSLLMEVAKELLGEVANENILKLCYNIGKFVYLADAIDDIGEDYKKRRYNPFLASLDGFKNRREFIETNRESLTFTLSVTINRAIECFNNLSFNQSYDLLRNIVFSGLRDKCDQLLNSTKKLKKQKI